MPAVSDRNLLCGILALQMDLITRDQLVAAMHAWVLDKSKSLGSILVDQKALATDSHALLEALVQKHLALHDNDPEKSLAAVSSIKSVRQELEQIADADLQESLVRVSAAPDEQDPFRTRPVAAGASTSAGLRFVVLRPHAKGGLGEVYVAHDQELHREVALKEIQDRYVDHPESRARFLLEAEITGGLEHPGIVPVYGLGQYADGRPFYAMRFIRGDSLKDAIDRFHRKVESFTSLEFRQLLGRFIDVCNAITYAHSRGVLHRDLKPGNIMLGNYGETLVVDWGLAKPVDRAEGPSVTEENTLRPASASGSAETQAGCAIGTPQYMSPEQAAGRVDLLGPASDVYSLGATLYCLLTGKPPFEGKDVGPVLRQVQRGEFSRPRQINPAVPLPLEAICLKAMALESKDRYDSPRALADDIEHWLADEPVSAWPEPWTVKARRWIEQHRVLVSGATAALVVLAIALVIAAVGSTIAARHFERLADEAKKAGDAERWERYRSNIAAGSNALQLFNTTEARRALEGAPPEHRGWEWKHFWNQLDRSRDVLPNGEDTAWVTPFHGHYFRMVVRPKQGRVRLVDPASGKELGTARLPSDKPRSMTLSPDGRRIAFHDEDGSIRLWDVREGRETGILRAAGERLDRAVFSSDANYVAAWGTKTLRLWDSTTGREAMLLGAGYLSEAAVAFRPDGRRVAFVVAGGASLDQIRLVDTASGKTDCLLGPTKHLASLAFSPDGKRLLAGQVFPHNDVQIWDLVTGKPIMVGSGHVNSVVCLAFSPDGRRFASASLDNTLRLWDGNLGTHVATMQHTNRVARVIFSPHSKQLVSSSQDGSIRIWDATTGKLTAALLGHNGCPRPVFVRHGELLLSHVREDPKGSDNPESSTALDNTVRVWDSERFERSVLIGHKGFAYDVGTVPYSPITRSSRLTN